MKRLYFLLFIPFLLSANVISHLETKIEMNSQFNISEQVKNGNFDYVLFLIEYGNSKAIMFAPKLLKYTDASLTESIYISLARGLIKSPERVLALKEINLNDICTVPFIEGPADIENIHINQALSVLSAIKFNNTELESRRVECISRFKSFTNLTR